MPHTASPAQNESAHQLSGSQHHRNTMVETLHREHQGGLSSEVQQALLRVPREIFLPGVALEDVYNPYEAIVTKRVKGIAVSSVSAPSIIAQMLDRSALTPGMRVLEIGSGGYNAALISELVGEQGVVTSIDIDSDVIDRARRCLSEAGYERVHTAVADGEYGFAENAPYDCIIVTAGAWDLPPAWSEQLTADGQIVVPMRLRGLTRCLTLKRSAQHSFISQYVDMCGFVRMQGAGEHWEVMKHLHSVPEQRVGLRLEDSPSVDEHALQKAFLEESVTQWSGVCIKADESSETQDLWIATAVEHWGVITAEQGAVNAGLITPTWILGTPTVIDSTGTSFAYRTLRKHPEKEALWEFGAVGHGSHKTDVATQLCAAMCVWDQQYRTTLGPQVTISPRATHNTETSPSRVVKKKHTQMTIAWPSANSAKEQM